MKKLLKLSPVLMVLLLASCTLFKTTPDVDTFNKKVATAYVTLTSVRATNLKLGVAGLISKEDVKNVDAQLDNVRTGITVARQYEALETGAGSDRLALTINALMLLQTYVNSKGGDL